MVERASALEGHYRAGHVGTLDATGVALTEVRDLVLYQVAAWPETLMEVGKLSAQAVGAVSAPGPCAAITGPNGSLLRIEPLKWWLVGTEAPKFDPEQGSTLDLSHSRTHFRISGEKAGLLLNRLLPLDLREASFPSGSVASSSMYHVGVTLWRSEQGYELFAPRGFALSTWEVILETAMQFGAEVV